MIEFWPFSWTCYKSVSPNPPIVQSERSGVEEDSQIKESKLTRVTPELVDEPAGEVAAEDGAQIIIRDLCRLC